MARRLVERGFRVHMVSSRRHKDGSSGYEQIEGIDVHWIAVPYDNTMGFHRRIMAFLQFSVLSSWKALRLKGDLVFATSTPLTIAIPGLLSKWIKRIPLVFEVRDLWPELPVAIGAIRSKHVIRAAKTLEKIAYHNSSHVIGLSPGMCEGIVRTGFPSEKVSLIPNSCDFDRFELPDPSTNSFRQSRKWLGDKPLVVYTGTFGQINGVSWLAELAAVVKTINPDIRFLAIGDGLEHEPVKHKARELGVLNDTFFVEPSIPKNEIPYCLAAASVCCSLFVPLKEMENNSANKFFDALAAGRPLLINYGGWHRQLIEQYELGVAALNDDKESAARQLVELIGSPTALLAAGKNAKALGMKSFSRDKLAAQLIDILEQVLSDTTTRLPPGTADSSSKTPGQKS